MSRMTLKRALLGAVTLAVVAAGASTAVVYGVNGLNLVSIVAVDSSGNTSAAISVTVAVEF